MKNTTLGRKPANEMKKNEGLYKPRTARNQTGDGADFAFNGQMGDGVNRAKNRFGGNPHGGLVKNPDTINHGQGPRKGNESCSGRERDIGPSATRDPKRMTIATASQGHNLGSATAKGFGNPDKIYVTKAER